MSYFLIFEVTKKHAFSSGQTDWNAKGLLQGRTDIPLNNHGRLQAKLAGVWLKEETYDTVYASLLSRAYDTAKILLDNQIQNNNRSSNIIKDVALIEREFGVFEGKPFNELVEAELASGKGFGMVRQKISHVLSVVEGI